MANLQRTQVSTQRTKPAKSATQPSVVPPAPSADRIAARAYEIWQESGCPEGCEQEHWLQAERELRERAES